MKKNLAFLMVVLLMSIAIYYFFGTEDQAAKKAYADYVTACKSAGEKDYTCRCQANLLRKKLSPEELVMLTEVGKAMERGDQAAVSEIQANYPQIFKVLQDMPDDVQNCVLE